MLPFFYSFCLRSWCYFWSSHNCPFQCISRTGESALDPVDNSRRRTTWRHLDRLPSCARPSSCACSNSLRRAELIILSAALIVRAITTAALRLLPAGWSLRRLPLCERSWPASGGSGRLLRAIWFSQSVMPEPNFRCSRLRRLAYSSNSARSKNGASSVTSPCVKRYRSR